MTIIEPPSLVVPMRVTLRPARKADLPKLEWYGQYTHFRNIFRKAFREQQENRRLMLVADMNNFPIGHVFIHFISRDAAPDDEPDSRAYLYAFRVMEMFRGMGIGTRLIKEAEVISVERGYEWMTLAVAKENVSARRLYERLNYRVFGEDAGRWSYVDHEGRTRYVNEPCWILQKRIRLR